MSEKEDATFGVHIQREIDEGRAGIELDRIHKRLALGSMTEAKQGLEEIGLDVIAGRLREFMGEDVWATEIENGARKIERLEAENKRSDERFIKTLDENRNLKLANAKQAKVIEAIKDLAKNESVTFGVPGKLILSIINAEGK